MQRRKKRRKQKQLNDPGILLLTQNVRGLPKATAAVDAWLDGLRLRTDHGPVDVVLLQETRATTRWRGQLHRKYAAGWGLRSDQHLDQWSFWGETPTAAGGVAILVRPGGRLRRAPVARLGRAPRTPAAVGLSDVLQSEQDQIHSESDRREFHAARHTFRYKLEGGDLATSRLDRFYIDKDHIGHIRHVDVVTPVSNSDHDGVLLLVADAQRRPPPRRQKARPRLKYPLHFGSQRAVTATSEQHLELLDTFCNEPAALTTHGWVQWKNKLRRQCLRRIRATAKQQTRSYRQRRKRLQRALHSIRPATSTGINATAATVPGITEGMERLCVDGSACARATRDELIRLTRPRGRRRRQHRYVTYAHGTPGSERAFFRRFHTRQGQRQAAPLPPDPTNRARPASRLAGDWKEVTQRGDRPESSRTRFLEGLPKVDRLPNLHALDDPFTEEETRRAIQACPRGKAPGPDSIPNDWYRDHADAVAPPLTRLFNAWHKSGLLPVSFRKALVACIPTTASPQTGLDYRPIALLDSDYKIYSRLILNRIRPHLPDLVSETQFGFVSGRQVHDALDVFHALQALVKEGAAPDTSLAISLDFAKAYDTLDRPFLLAVLDRLGCPKLFRNAVEHMHLATTAAYMADADISDDQPVLNGIRQGCPLAPTLFVLAVDTLYQAVIAGPHIEGIPLPSGSKIGPAGFADDTNVYTRSEASVGPLLELLRRFEDASTGST